jgi:hypothetical protein
VKPRVRLPRWAWALVPLLAAHAASLMRFPAPSGDEAWFTSRAWAYAQSGVALGELDRGVIDRLPGHESYFWLLQVWPQAQVLKLVGEPSLLAARAVSLAFGCVLLLATGGAGWALGGPRLAAAAAVTAALLPAFFVSAHLARPDVLASALGMLGVALVLGRGRRPAGVAAAAGLVIGLAFEAHAHSVIYALGALAVLAAQERRRIWRSTRLWSFGAGLGVGLAFYVLVHIAPSPRDFFAIHKLLFESTHEPPLLSPTPAALAGAFADLGALVFASVGWLLPVAVAALVSVVSRARAEPRGAEWLSVVLVPLVGAALLWRNKLPYYGIYVAPALALAIGAFAVRLVDAPWSSRRARGALAALTIACVAIALGSLAPRLARDTQAEFAQTCRSLRAALRPSDVVIGRQTYWFCVPGQPFRAWEQLVFHRRLFPQATLEARIVDLGASFFLIDDYLRQFVRDEPGPGVYGLHLRLPKRELDELLARSGEPVLDVRSPIYGSVTGFRLSLAGQRPP